MALNKLMHPRNPYRDKRPNFKELAQKYEQFRKHAFEDERGGYHIDFKSPEGLRALTWALLKNDYGLDVLMPLDRLIPTVPLRINYLLWLEDILNKPEDVKGIDIGAGASCVYGLLGAKKNSWTFLSTEADATNFEYAKKNVSDNNLSHKISVVKVSETTILYDLLSDSDTTYDFCMCNPPFFGSNFEAWGMLTTRSDDRPEPSSVNTASPAESIAPGGEVNFVKRMIADSVHLGDRIRVYTTMLGKKSSLPVLREELKRNGVANIGQTEFCQGKTMRWGLGWSFDDTVSFPKPPSKVMKAEKPKPPLVYPFPRETLPEGYKYSVVEISKLLTGLLDQLEILCNSRKSSKDEEQFDLTAVKNTWSNQRRKRRQLLSQQAAGSSDTADSCTQQEENKERSEGNMTENGKRKRDDNSEVESLAKKQKIDEQSAMEDANTAGVQHNNGRDSQSASASTTNVEDFLFKCSLCVKQKSGGDVVLEMQWVEGDNRELMHQVLQYIKNKFK